MAARKKKVTTEKLSYEEWQQQCSKAADKLLNLGDILDDDDPYDLFEYMKERYEAGENPESFIRDAFAEDLAIQEHDAMLAQESLEYSEESYED